MELDAFAWLLTEPGQRLLARASELRGEDPLRAHTLLRKDAEASYVAVALSQAELRAKAAVKFGALAERMYFTPDGLEQATRLPVAEHRAARLAAYGARTLVDLGCGIGGDLIATSRAGLIVAGVDLDPERVAVAQANLDALELPGAVQVADATDVNHAAFEVAFADPARRGARGRALQGWRSDAEGWTPPWSFVATLLTRDACVKVAPGIPHELVPAGVEAEWVSDHGEVKEAALWAGGLATVRRRATVIGDGGLATGFLVIVQCGQPVDRIDQRDHAIDREITGNIRMSDDRLDHGRGIGKPGRFDHHPLQRLDPTIGQRFAEIDQRIGEFAAHGAAETAIRELDHGVARGFDQKMIDTDFAEFVDDHGGVGHVRVFEQPVEHGRFARTEKTGEDRDRNTLRSGSHQLTGRGSGIGMTCASVSP